MTIAFDGTLAAVRPLFPTSAPHSQAAGHTADMDDVVYMVRGTTRAVCQRELDRLCALLDARPTMLPTAGTGRGWVARAVPTAKAPTERDGRGPVVSG